MACLASWEGATTEGQKVTGAAAGQSQSNGRYRSRSLYNSKHKLSAPTRSKGFMGGKKRAYDLQFKRTGVKEEN